MLEQFSLTNQVAVITGGGTGLGFGIARTFVQAGATVVLLGRREDKLREAQQTLGTQCHYRVFDVTNKPAMPALVADIENNIGAIDILVNCAGIHLKKMALDVTDQEYLSVIDTHVLSVFALSREVLRYMVPRKRGNIILISSMAAFMGLEKIVAYTTAKSAVLGIQRSLIADYSRSGIRVNTIAPGWIETDISRYALDGDPERKAKILSRIPTHTFGDPDDIGNAALYLCSAAGKYVNGVTLPVDAGAVEGF